MKMRLGLFLVALMLPVPLAAQQPPHQGQGPQQRREMLQRQIGERFMENVARQLRLEPQTRTRLQQHLLRSGEQRRDLAERSQILRLQMSRAARDSTTSDAELRRLIGEATSLKAAEDELWREDQAALGRILTPRQQVQFMFMWLRLNEQIRDMTNRGPEQRRPF